MEATLNGDKKSGFLTWRSIIFGLLGITIMAGLSGYHDNVLGGNPMIGNHMPAGVFTYLIFIGLGWNGLWTLVDRLCRAKGHLRDALALSTKEMVVVMAVTLVSCFPPTSGLMRYFIRIIMMPWYFITNKPDWVSHGLLTQYIRPELFPDPWPGLGTTSAEYEYVYKGLYTGLAKGTQNVGLWDLPFKAWMKPLMIWGPAIFLMALACISLQFLVHRQWSKHEQLSYPIAQVTGSFCQISGSGRGIPDVFRSSLFWWGFSWVTVLLLIHYLSTWFPQYVPSIRDMMPNLLQGWMPIADQIPVLKKVPSIWSLNRHMLYFSVVALAYFVSTEVSLTVGVSVISLAIFGVCYLSVTGVQLEDSWIEASRSGAYLGYSLILAYTGRLYFKSVFAKAFFFNRKGVSSEHVDEDDEKLSVMAARILVLSFVGFIVVLSWMLQSWTMAIFYSLFLMMMLLVISRVASETGIFFIQSNWMPSEMLVRLLGPAAVGPKTLPTMLWANSVFVEDPRESLMPYVSTAAKAAEDAGIKLRKLFWVIVGAVIVALVIAYLNSMHSLYNNNPMSDGYAAYHPVQRTLDAASRHFNAMKATGIFEKSAESNSVTRLALAQTSPKHLEFFIWGALAVLGVTLLRFRFTRFPLHPVLFIMIGTYPANFFWGSFLIGFFVKTLVVRFGGGKVYQQLKPFFIGMIASELFIMGISIIVDFAYFFLHNGTPSPIKFSILPG